ncbi:type I restriction-modification system subunit M [Selenomonas noxia]|uniref:site-specific DNA-methyltransferase (adenine-specific) n=1 Tax=Selenomonas noxia F0398 TaxID=702437 RepID=A0ABN0DPZ7_9FIRM|nr:type I restriction-modification system subunit M [Selenomonas noxia]EHG24937.1 hypothetical protein HMPREF9432_00967 [Selenomonas noxia F0398]
MNKQELASTIWESANQMRSKIEANEYKDFILGFIFYKYVSDKEVLFFERIGMTEDKIKSLKESQKTYVNHAQKKLGYFIAYDNLFSTWIEKKSKFDVSDVRKALSAFDRLIGKSHKKLFTNIFKTLQTGLSKLGATASEQTKAIRKLIGLIDKIPMDGKQDYDVLGFIYEYLISMFAANAGKKAGEFYTPHEVSLLMSEIVAEHLKEKTEIRIYDPTSGSGSLLINIGRSVSKRMESSRVEYYAQELKENTYNLTRMNLVMRGIEPASLNVRNGDTLEEDWPFFEDDDPATYCLLHVSAVVSNPPYSQKWDNKNQKSNPRFSSYGVAPAGKADYAFLLHDLYHLEEDGIMAIVLPHGVLFRGNEEEEIRKNLIEKNNIDVIIGLPANIFFGTSIATIVMILKRKRESTDVLFIDASKGYEKADKNNRLRASDIKRIADTVRDRSEIYRFSRRVSKEEIRENGYNLNIPRYVSSAEPAENWDVHAIMFGGIPKVELDALSSYWEALPGLRESLFREISSDYVETVCENVLDFTTSHEAAIRYKADYIARFDGFEEILKDDLITKMRRINIVQEEEKICGNIFGRLTDVKAIDRYRVYQILDEAWQIISPDLEMIQTEGFSAVMQVDPNMVLKKKENENEDKVEVQKGWKGHILPFLLVQKELMPLELANLRQKEDELADTIAVYSEIIDSLSEDEKGGEILNDSNTAFNSKTVEAVCNAILKEVETEETIALVKYLELNKKKDKLAYIENTSAVDWVSMEMGSSGLYGKRVVESRILSLKLAFEFPEDSYEAKMLRVFKTMAKEAELKREIKAMSAELHAKTKETIENLDGDTAKHLLDLKWIQPLVTNIYAMPVVIIGELVKKINALTQKYKVTFSEVEERRTFAEKKLSGMMDGMKGNDFDMNGLHEFRRLLEG